MLNDSPAGLRPWVVPLLILLAMPEGSMAADLLGLYAGGAAAASSSRRFAGGGAR